MNALSKTNPPADAVAALAGDDACWCASLPALPPDCLRPGAQCLCPACLSAEIERADRACHEQSMKTGNIDPARR